MNETNNNRTLWLHVRLNPKEHHQLMTAFGKTTTSKLSEYARKVLLGKPIIASHRNSSLDDLMAELIRLRKELNGLGNNFNQLVKRLHNSQDSGGIVSLLHHYENDKLLLLKQVEAIQLLLEKYDAKW